MPNKILLIDDDPVFCQTLSRSLHRRGYQVLIAHTRQQALEPNTHSILQVVLDLQLHNDSGLSLIAPLLNLEPQRQIILLTGYASISTAVEAIKRGAKDYLCKPATTQDILRAFAHLDSITDSNLSTHADDPSTQPQSITSPVKDPAPTPLSLEHLEWAHLQRVLQTHQGNISACARALNMHRRTLQRKLQKRPSPNPKDLN